MENSRNLSMLVALGLFVVMFFLLTRNEGFSASGMAVSDVYCTQLADIYYQPRITDIDQRNDFRGRICGPQRRTQVDFPTGNYLTVNGMLV